MAVRLWAFFLLGFHLAACFPFWVASAAAWELASHFFPYLFLWSLRSMVLGRGSAEGSPLRVVSSLQFFLRVTCLRSGGGGFGWLSLAGPYVLRDVYLVPV